MSAPLRIRIDRWVIQDGNYRDFSSGENRAFAVEFWSPNPLKVRHPDAAHIPLSMEWLRGSTYLIAGKVAFVDPAWWVLDIGIPAYSNQLSPPGPIGTPVEGEIDLAVDHFSYFERLSRSEGTPPLIFDWRIEAIERDDTPLLEATAGYFERDASNQRWTKVSKTQAWDDGVAASYMLTCTRLPGEARHKL